jgi:uncharacterized oxidoreductase
MNISANRLRVITQHIVQAMGSDESEARIVADHLVRANLAGHDSHGVGMLPMYALFFNEGLLKPNTGPKCITDHGAILVYDGERGFGQRTIREVMSKTIERAKELGLAASAVRNAHHIGRVGTYGEQAIDAGMISIHFANVIDHAAFVAPFRGSDARFGTNPMCIALPETYQGAALLLDFATSRAAVGKARVAMNKGLPMAEGYLIDAKGQPTTNPDVMFSEPRGALTAMGDHKGYGIAMFAEILASVLSGGNTIQPEHETKGSIMNNIFTIVLDPEKFGDVGRMRAEIKAYADYVTASPEANPGEPVLVPGQPEYISAQEREKNGIPIDPTTWEQILEASVSLGLEREQISALASSDA